MSGRTAGDVPLDSHGELSTRIERDPRSAADDDGGTFPGPLVRYERHFLGHPGLPCAYGRCVAWLADTGSAAPFNLPLIRLDPDRSVSEVGAFAPRRRRLTPNLA